MAVDIACAVKVLRRRECGGMEFALAQPAKLSDIRMMPDRRLFAGGVAKSEMAAAACLPQSARTCYFHGQNLASEPPPPTRLAGECFSIEVQLQVSPHWMGRLLRHTLNRKASVVNYAPFGDR